jgi:uncharacterized membrane protein HdeD (DUF308 family)
VREHRSAFLVLGILFVVLGGLAILLPFAASLVTAFVLGCLMIVAGLFQGYHALQNRRWGGSVWAIVGAVLYVAAGALVVAFPLTGTLTLTLVLAAFLVANGILKIIRAVQHRGMPPWGWLLFDGLISLALGVLLWAGWPSTAAWALGVLVGIDLIASGTSVLLIGYGARPALGGAR